MDLTRFTRIVEAYGSQPAHWPAAERTAASQFAAKNNPARQLLEQHSQLDSQLHSYLQADTLATHKHLNLSRLEANLLARVATLEQLPDNGQQASSSLARAPAAAARQARPALAGLVALLAGTLDHFIAWLLPAQPQPAIICRPAIWRPAICRPAIWRPTLLAALPLIAGLLIGSNLQLDNLDYTDTWEDEVYLLALVPDATETLP